jgi:predicted AAA+ superfamily ATPase
MESAALLDIARAWSFWDRPLPDTVARTVSLPDTLRSSLALVVLGVRRCGKSTLLHQLVERYALDPARCLFVNLEDPRLANAQHFDTLQGLVDAFRSQHGDDGPLYFFLDEVQGVEGWQRWLRSQLDRPGADHFVVTGSNATMLSGELASTLTGRHLTVELFPFDLDEFRRARAGAALADYLEAGGFPEPLALTDGDRLRRQYFLDIVERDVRERVGARSSLPVRQVAQMAFESAGAELSLRRIAAATGIAVETAASYLEACEAAYLLFGCPFFAYSERKRASRNKKYYPVDPGLRRVATTRGGADRGKALEIATFVALRRTHREVFYWRDKGEVDFVVQRDGVAVPVQVTWDGPQDRHERALESFYEQHPHAGEAVFVTAESFEEVVGEWEG